MDPSSPPPPYAHIFQKGQPKIPWPELDADACLSLLHAKYWGKDIREEMCQWQERQTRGQPINTDQSNVLPANFALYFDIDDLNTSSMWVPEDYGLLYDHCTSHFNQPEIRFSPMPVSIVITGQPGIGK